LQDIDKILEATKKTNRAGSSADSIDALVERLNGDTAAGRGISPIIDLASNAVPQEIVGRAAKHWVVDGGQIKTFKILEVRNVSVKTLSESNCSAALIDSNLGKKILLFSYRGERGWWTHFYNADIHESGK
jgi:hypothetical protein